MLGPFEEESVGGSRPEILENRSNIGSNPSTDPYHADLLRLSQRLGTNVHGVNDLMRLLMNGCIWNEVPRNGVASWVRRYFT